MDDIKDIKVERGLLRFDQWVEVSILRARGLLSRDKTQAVAPITSESSETYIVASILSEENNSSENNNNDDGMLSRHDASRVADGSIHMSKNSLFVEHKEEFQQPMIIGKKKDSFEQDIIRENFNIENENDPTSNTSTLINERNILMRTPKCVMNINPTFDSEITTFKCPLSSLPVTFDIFGATLHSEFFLGRAYLNEHQVRNLDKSLLDDELRLEIVPRENERDPVISQAASSMFTGLGLLVVSAKVVEPPPPPPTAEEIEAERVAAELEAARSALIPITSTGKLEILSPKRIETEIARPGLLGNTNTTTFEQLIEEQENQEEPMHVSQMIEISIVDCVPILRARQAEIRAGFMSTYPGKVPPAPPTRFEIVAEAFNTHTLFSSGPLSTDLEEVMSTPSIPLLSVYGSVCAAFKEGTIPLKLKFVEYTLRDRWNSLKKEWEELHPSFFTNNNNNNNPNNSSSANRTVINENANNVNDGTSSNSGSSSGSKLEPDHFLLLQQNPKHPPQDEVFAETYCIINNAGGEGTSSSTNDGDDQMAMNMNMSHSTTDIENSKKRIAGVPVPHPDQHHSSGEAVNPFSSAGIVGDRVSLPLKFNDKYGGFQNEVFVPRTVDVAVKSVLSVPSKSITESQLYQGKGLLKIEVREVRDLICNTTGQNLFGCDAATTVSARTGMTARTGRSTIGGGGSHHTGENNANKNENNENNNVNENNDNATQHETISNATTSVTTNYQPPEPISVEVSFKDHISDKHYKLLGRSPVVLPEEDAFFGFTTTVELEQLRNMPEAIIVTVFQGQNPIAKSVIRTLFRRSIDGTWVTLKPPVKRGQEVSEGLRGMVWVRWIATANNQNFENSENERFSRMNSIDNNNSNNGKNTLAWITKDSIIPDLIKSSAQQNKEQCSMIISDYYEDEENDEDEEEEDDQEEEESRNEKQNRQQVSFTDMFSTTANNKYNNNMNDNNNKNNNPGQVEHYHLNKKQLRNRYREGGAFCLDWNQIPLGYAIKIVYQHKTIFGPAMRIQNSNSTLRIAPIVVYLKDVTTDSGPVIIQTHRIPDQGKPLVCSKETKIWETKCWLPILDPSIISADQLNNTRRQSSVFASSTSAMMNASSSYQGNNNNNNNKKERPHPPCFLVSLDEIASIKLPCRWVPLSKKYPVNNNASSSSYFPFGVTSLEDDMNENPEDLARGAKGGIRKKKKKDYKAPPLHLRILGPAFPSLPCQLDEEEDTLQKIQPFIERHFGISIRDQIFHQGRLKLVPTGRPQASMETAKGMQRVSAATTLNKENPGSTVENPLPLTVSHRDARSLFLTVKFPTLGGILIPIACPPSTTCGMLRTMLAQAIQDRGLVNPENDNNTKIIFYGTGIGVTKISHLTKVLNDETKIKNLGTRPEVSLTALVGEGGAEGKNPDRDKMTTFESETFTSTTKKQQITPPRSSNSPNSSPPSSPNRTSGTTTATSTSNKNATAATAVSSRLYQNAAGNRKSTTTEPLRRSSVNTRQNQQQQRSMMHTTTHNKMLQQQQQQNINRRQISPIRSRISNVDILRQELDTKLQRVKELEDTVARQQELLRRVSGSM